jgi:hypothetical protein
LAEDCRKYSETAWLTNGLARRTGAAPWFPWHQRRGESITQTPSACWWGTEAVYVAGMSPEKAGSLKAAWILAISEFYTFCIGK